MELRPGYKQTEVGAFPEDWEITELGKLFSFKNGVNAEKHAYGAGIRFINVLETITYSHLRGEEATGRVTLPDTAVNIYAVKHGDVLFNRTSETDSELALAATYIGAEKVVFGGFVIRGRSLGKQLDPFYCGYALRAPVLRSQIIPMGQGAVRANIGQESLSRVLAPVPPLAEQRAIAAALSDVDALIAGLEKLIYKKRDLKQATMQQLLTGKTRLPNFYGTWSLGSLGDVVASLEAGVSVNSTDDMPFPGVYCVLKTSALEGGEFLPQECKVIESGDIRRARTNPRRDTILISRMNTPLLVGEIAYIDQDYDWLFLPDRIWMTRFKTSSNLCVRWLAYVLSSRSYREALQEIATGTSGSMKNISKSALLALPIEFPEPSEQTAIATVLSDMDTELAALEARLAKTRALKQGLMQELLTGRTRLV